MICGEFLLVLVKNQEIKNFLRMENDFFTVDRG